MILDSFGVDYDEPLTAECSMLKRTVKIPST